MSNPRVFFEKLLAVISLKGTSPAKATRAALKHIVIGEHTPTAHWQGPKLAGQPMTSAVVKRKHRRKMQQASRRRNREQ